MSDYTPTTEEIVHKFATGATWQHQRYSEAEAEIRRWLAQYTAEKRAEWEAEQGDKPSPCVMTHTPPFDFAQCETHDETFPLGGVCKWHGKESIYEVLEDEADALRMRAVRAEHQLEILRAEQGETEWEYGATNVFDDKPVSIRDTLAEAVEAQAFYTRERGRKTNLMMRAKAVPAGPWLPVPGTTNNESEGKA